MDGYEMMAEVAKALGHPVRLHILAELRREEACVCHLEAVLGQRQAYISQQLARLRDAGLVVDRRDGLNVFYSLAGESTGALLDALQAAAESLAGVAGRPLVFAPPVDGAAVSCGCPKCQERVGSIEQAGGDMARR